MKRIILGSLLLPLCIVAVAEEGRMHLAPHKKVAIAEQIIENYYVDKVNADSVAEEGIRAMLKTLDPHSTYSDPEATKALTEPLQGNFSGIGIEFSMINDTLRVIQPTSGGPSEKVGIQPGDRIIAANDTAISGVKMKNSDVIKRLRGPKGTKVKLTVKRGNQPSTIDFIVKRDDIPLYSVDAYYMVDPQTGYVRLTRFAESSFDEVSQAITDLKKHGMKNLILDLEGNGGGYLNIAAMLSNLFLDKNSTIVYTGGDKVKPQYFKVVDRPMMPEGRLVIMVDQNSASASEIVSGAIQDNDRGVIVGRRTFGKGLVQRPFPLPDGSMIRLTVAHYYTPSGRSIQRPYTSGDTEEYYSDLAKRLKTGELSNADSVHLDRSLVYHTLNNKRPVYGGGGIMPDRFVPIDTAFYSNYYRDLVAKGALNRAAVEYVEKNRKSLKKKYPTDQDFINNFNVGQDLLDNIISIGKSEGVEYNEEQFDKSRSFITTLMKGLIGRDVYGRSTYYQIVNKENPTYLESITIINDGDLYDRLLLHGDKEE